jgi:hypothetical protein
MNLIDCIKEEKKKDRKINIRKNVHSLYFIYADLLVAGADSFHFILVLY